MLLVAVIFVLGTAGFLQSDFLATFLIQIVVVAGVPIIIYSLFVTKSIKQTFFNFGFKKLSTKLVLLSFAVGIVLYLLNIFVADSFATFIVLLGYETTIPTLSVSYSGMLVDFLLTACLPGLCEEILHRGLVLNGCKKEGYTRYGLIISSILFGLLHLNILQFFYATILGFCIGLSVLATESIWTGIICHFTNNFLSVYFSYDTEIENDVVIEPNVVFLPKVKIANSNILLFYFFKNNQFATNNFDRFFCRCNARLDIFVQISFESDKKTKIKRSNQ